MVTLSEGVEVTGLPLMYSYWDGITSSVVIDVENHSVIIRKNKMTSYERRSHEQGNYEITPTYTDLVNLVSSPILIPLIDS